MLSILLLRRRFGFALLWLVLRAHITMLYYSWLAEEGFESGLDTLAHRALRY